MIAGIRRLTLPVLKVAALARRPGVLRRRRGQRAPSAEAVRVTAAGAAAKPGAKPCGRPCPRSDGFVAARAARRRRAEPATEFRVAYDATTLFVKVRAFDTEPDKIVTLPHAPRRRFAVRLDSRPDRLVSRPAHGVRVRRQPVRREAGSLLVQRHQQRRQLGRGVGRHASRATRRAGWPSSGFRFRSCASRRRTTNTFGFAVVARDRPAERDVDLAAAGAQRQRLRVVVRRAGRPVDGRVAEAARAAAVHRRQT